MKLERVEISNFMSFGPDLSWDVPEESNLLLLVKGEYIGRVKSNGAGKSSVFEAVYWALTGSVVRSIKAAQVIRIGTKQCKVSVFFTHGGWTYRVTRTRYKSSSPVLVTFLNVSTGEVYPCHTAEEGTNLIMETLGISPEVLAMIAFFGHGFLTFSRLEPSRKAALVAKIAKSDVWESARVLAVSRVKDLNSRLELHTTMEATTEQDIDNLNDDIQRMMVELQDKEDELERTRVTLNDRISTKQDQVGVLEEKLANLEEEKSSVEAEYQEATDLLSELEKSKSTLAGEIKALNTQLDDLTLGIQGNVCPTCGQTIKRTKAVKERIEDIKGNLKRLTVAKSGLEEEGRVLRQLVLKTTERTTLLSRAVKHVTEEIGDHTKAMATTAEQIERLDLDAVKVSLNAKLEYAKKELSNTENALRQTRDKIDRCKTLLLVTNFWVTGFKVLRLESMTNVVRGLEKSISALAKQLGLVADRVEMGVKAESSTGGFKPAVTLGIVRDDTYLHISQLSTGETQCLDLACFLVSSTWIEQGYGLDIGFKVFDEPLEGLDADSKYKVFQALKMVTGQKFVIDHDAHFADQMENVLEVVKGEDHISRF